MMASDVDPKEVGILIGQMQMLIPQVKESVKNQQALDEKIDKNHEASQEEMKQVKQCLTKTCDKKSGEIYSHVNDEVGKVHRRVDDHLAVNHNSNQVKTDEEQPVFTKNQLVLIAGGTVTIIVGIATWIQQGGLA